MESKKYNKIVNKTKKKQTHKYREQTSAYLVYKCLPGEREEGRGNIGVGN